MVHPPTRALPPPPAAVVMSAHALAVFKVFVLGSNCRNLLGVEMHKHACIMKRIEYLTYLFVTMIVPAWSEKVTNWAKSLIYCSVGCNGPSLGFVDYIPSLIFFWPHIPIQVS
ncbi:hypothetical protein L211DRAFT_379791 [Terfezia boudieri ATCC MYA-4762]|uniref:Uncharacterized protein n=1 Tax=Terfezia boudieri ATCC MYA-4762 TaxID=1051890 RepID=A0A3N4LZN0_9PEZI|nr:hypothetical protein L211DRAFT_379791 [Terfezia boudieri ATCC MYA-4762]